MKVLIVYATKYGCSEKCAKLLSEKIIGETELIDINNSRIPDLCIYDKIIIGGPIYMGMIKKEVSDFCNSNLKLLKTKKIGLFVCSMFGGEKAEETLKRAFPIELQNIAVTKQLFGGELKKEKMRFMDKFITKMVDKMPLQPGESVNEGILVDNIDKLAEDINNS